MGVKSYRFECVKFTGDTKKRWWEIADKCREIVNCIWQHWEVWHVNRESDLIIRKHNKEWATYKRARDLEKKEAKEAKERKEQPKPPANLVEPQFPVQHWTSEFTAHLTKVLNVRYPEIHTRVVNLLMQITQRRMKGKDCDGQRKIWTSVLLNRQSRPSKEKDAPIPFDKENSSPLKLVEGEFTNYCITVRLTREPRDGMKANSLYDTVHLKARGRGLAVMRRIVSGEYEFGGSSFLWSKSKRKWFCYVAFNDHKGEKPKDGSEEGARDPEDNVAVLWPCKKRPWKLRALGRSYKFGGTGNYIAATRHRLLAERWSRQENYRYAGSSNKGRGRKRAMQGVNRWSEGWKDFAKTANHTLTKDLVSFCVREGITKLVYCQPMDLKRENRFLHYAGKHEGREDSTGWDWSQVGTFLGYKCKDEGIHLVIRKCLGGEDRMEEMEARRNNEEFKKRKGVPRLKKKNLKPKVKPNV